MAPEVMDQDRWDAAEEAVDRFLNLDERQPLSPMWQVFIKDMVINGNQKLLDNYDAGKIKGRDIGEKARAMFKRSCSLDPFDFSDDAVNQHRASKFRGVLDLYREEITPRKFAGRAWWPQTNAGIIAAIIAERGGRQPKAAEGSGSTIRAGAQSAKPALPWLSKISRSREDRRHLEHDCAAWRIQQQQQQEQTPAQEQVSLALPPHFGRVVKSI